MELFLFWTCSSIMGIYILIPTIYRNIANPSNIRLIIIIENIFYTKNNQFDRGYISERVKITLLLGILFFLLITLDSNYSIITPKISFIEEPITYYNDVLVIKDINNKFIPILEKEILYHIKIPFMSKYVPFSIKYFKLKNPNNVTLYDKKYNTKIEDNDLFDVQITKDSISILLNNISKNEIILKLDYYIELNIDKVLNYKEDIIKYIDDDKEKTNYSIRLENIGNQLINFDNIKLLKFYEYDNIWNYTTDNSNIYTDIYQYRDEIIMYCNLKEGDVINIYITIER